jgi:hypothetical protein
MYSKEKLSNGQAGQRFQNKTGGAGPAGRGGWSRWRQPPKRCVCDILNGLKIHTGIGYSVGKAYGGGQY